MNRSGSTVDDGSSRYHTTDAAGASPALSEMNTPPVLVAAHTVPVLLSVRSTAATNAPARSVPYAVLVRSVIPAAPSWTKSPQVGVNPEVVNSGQFASRNAWLPPQS